METKHTPGPWWYEEKHGHNVYAGTGEDRKVADIRGWGWLQYKGEKAGAEEMDANGHLIAAAPELLEALEEVLRAGNTLTESLYERIYLAVEKATGVAP